VLTPALLVQHEVQLVCEMDEQWSYVGNKKQQRWLWYAWLPQLKTVLASTLGARTDDALKRLLPLLKPWNIALYCTDGWEAYQRYLPQDKPLITKRYTQSIERQNLNFRTRIKRLARKTICFSKSVEIHDKVIGEFINRSFFNSSKS
jgi:insertion element IS1 protein InsB